MSPTLRRPAAFRTWAVIVGAVVLVGHLWTLQRIPAPFVDEAWFADRAWSLVTSGVPYGTLDHGVIDNYTGSALFFPLLPVMVQAAALAVAGQPSLLALRLLSLAAGGLLLLAVWTIGDSYYDRMTGAVAALVLSLSGAFILSSHLARYDIFASALGFSGMAIYARSSRHGRGWEGLAGFVAGLAAEFHPFAIVIAVSLVVLAAADHRGEVTWRRSIGRLLVGLVLGVALYPVIHILPFPGTYYALTRIIYGPSHVPALTAIPLGVWETVTLASDLFYSGAFIAPAALAVLVVSPKRPDRHLAVMGVTMMLAFSLLVRNKIWYYAILFVPALAVVTAAALRRLTGFWTSPAARASAVAGLLVLFAAGSLRTAVWLRPDPQRDLSVAVEALRSVLRPGERIMGSQTYWFGLYTYPYFSWEQLIYLTRAHPGTSIVDALAEMRPDIIVRDAHLDQFIHDDAGDTTYQQLLKLPRTELETWLESNAVVVASVDAGVYGRVRAYRVTWPEPGR